MRTQASHNQYVIDITKPWHVAWWAVELGVSEGALLEAVAVVGNQARAVQAYLFSQKSRRSRPHPRRVPTTSHGSRRASGSVR